MKKILIILVFTCNYSIASDNEEIIKSFFPKQVDVFGVKILALELGTHNLKVIGVNFDMLDGGMNANVSKATKIAARDRSPIGKIPTMDEAALDLKWVLDNAGSLISGAVIDLSGGNIP